MKGAIEIFGKGFEFDIGGGMYSLTIGSLLDVLTCWDGTHGRRWFDWLSDGRGGLEVWMGGRRWQMTWGPAFERSQRAQAMNEGAAA